LAFDDAGKKLYAATDQGLFVSTNGGLNWQHVGSSGSSATNLPIDSSTTFAFDINNPSVIYVGTAQHGVYASTDGGASWTLASDGLPANIPVNGLSFDADQHQLWAATSVGVYRSDNRGTSWRSFNTGFPPNVVIHTVIPASVSGGAVGLIYAGTDKGFYRSQDSGRHWSINQEGLAGTSIHRILVDFRSTNATTVYAACDAGAFRSDDNGLNWRAIAPGLPKNGPVYSIILGATGYSQLFIATNDVYLFPGTSGGITPSRILPILIVLVFFFLLFRLTRRSRRSRSDILKPDRIIETPASE
jgi:photosystem II stability/assembly factor-like uncharacterized protein